MSLIFVQMLEAARQAGVSRFVATRGEIYGITWQAIRDTFPVGTGLGTFQAYYRLYENPALLNSFFVNHAHSDPVEWVLETGLPGVLLLGAFLPWWATRVVQLWRAEQPDLGALAATVSSGAILAHSVVDYPSAMRRSRRCSPSRSPSWRNRAATAVVVGRIQPGRSVRPGT